MSIEKRIDAAICAPLPRSTFLQQIYSPRQSLKFAIATEDVKCTTLIDTCSSANFVTEAVAERLKLPTRKRATTIEALNQLSTVTNKIVTATVR